MIVVVGVGIAAFSVRCGPTLVRALQEAIKAAKLAGTAHETRRVRENAGLTACFCAAGLKAGAAKFWLEVTQQ